MMNAARIVSLPEEPKRTRRRVLSAIAARQRLEGGPRPRRRAWITGAKSEDRMHALRTSGARTTDAMGSL